jgi:hypothetical protein
MWCTALICRGCYLSKVIGFQAATVRKPTVRVRQRHDIQWFGQHQAAIAPSDLRSSAAGCLFTQLGARAHGSLTTASQRS